MTVTAYLGSPPVGSQQGKGHITVGDTVNEGTVLIGYPTSIPRDASGFLVIEPDSFAQLARCMMQANPDAAIKAFGAALQAGVPKQERTPRLAELSVL